MNSYLKKLGLAASLMSLPLTPWKIRDILPLASEVRPEKWRQVSTLEGGAKDISCLL